jgi:pimeloyl-ACP methyl ester carboxylesterase
LTKGASIQRITSANGITVSYDEYGSGPPLVLVHGGFSDHISNWEFVKPFFEKQFTVYAIARRGRGATSATKGHTLEDEGMDVVAVMESIDKPMFLLGHSYGGQVALAAAAKAPDRVSKLVLYEPPWPTALERELLVRLESLAEAGEWDDFAMMFFGDGLRVPANELEDLRASSQLWAPILGDAEASWGDLCALIRYNFNVERFRQIRVPVMLQVGTESPRELYVTDELASVFADVRIEELHGQAHEGMTTAPRMYADAVMRFLLG